MNSRNMGALLALNAIILCLQVNAAGVELRAGEPDSRYQNGIVIVNKGTHDEELEVWQKIETEKKIEATSEFINQNLFLDYKYPAKEGDKSALDLIAMQSVLEAKIYGIVNDFQKDVVSSNMKYLESELAYDATIIEQIPDFIKAYDYQKKKVMLSDLVKDETGVTIDFGEANRRALKLESKKNIKESRKYDNFNQPKPASDFRITVNLANFDQDMANAIYAVMAKIKSIAEILKENKPLETNINMADQEGSGAYDGKIIDHLKNIIGTHKALANATINISGRDLNIYTSLDAILEGYKIKDLNAVCDLINLIRLELLGSYVITSKGTLIN